MFKTMIFTIIFCLFTAAMAWANHANLSECLEGCPMGDQACSNYCSSLFGPCFNKCLDIAKAKGLNSVEVENCRNNCRSIKKKIDYPGWMPKQECPYDCQTWNPISRSCVGAEMNGCSW